MVTTAPVLEKPSSKAQSDVLLHVQDLHIHFETPGGLARVVDGATLTVHRNEIVGIAGESGSGKTTLVEAILQIIRFPNRVTSGHVMFYPSKGKPIDLMELTQQRDAPGPLAAHLLCAPGLDELAQPGRAVGDQIVDGMTAHGVSETRRSARCRLSWSGSGLSRRSPGSTRTNSPAA